MSKPADFPRNDKPPPVDSAVKPAYTVRAYLPLTRVFGQYLFTCLVSGLTIGLGCFGLFFGPFPGSLVSVLVIPGGPVLSWFVGRHDYAWIELTENKLRARHLYSWRIFEFPLDEVDRLEAYDLAPGISFAMKGAVIRLWDERQRLWIPIADPAMKNAKELIAAINDRLARRIIAGENCRRTL